MLKLKIAHSPLVQKYFTSTRELVLLNQTDFTDIGAIILTAEDVKYIQQIKTTEFNIPIFVVLNEGETLSDEYFDQVYHVQDLNSYDINLYSRQIETAASLYEQKMLPPFFKMLSEYVEMGNLAFDCPGHQGGQYFRKHQPAVIYTISMEKIFSVQIFVMLM